MNDNLILGAKEKERSTVKPLTTFLLNDCYNKELLYDGPEIEKSLECLLCGQIAGNAMELTCNFHVKQENPLIIGENCLIRYLESNNNRCPKDNHINCDYTIAKLARTLINNLTIGCPGKSIIQLNQMANNANVSSICCGFKGKISAIKKHLEESCTFKLIDCEFKKYGCVDIVTRFNYKEHYKLEIDKHLELMKNYIVKLETKEGPLDEKKCANDQKGNCTFFNFKLSKSFIGSGDSVTSIDYAITNDYQLLCSGSEDNTVYIWNIDTKEKIGKLHGHSNIVSCVKFSPYHRFADRRTVICSASLDKTICFWDINDNKVITKLNGPKGVTSITFSPFSSGEYLCFGSCDKTVCLYDIKRNKTIVFNGHTDSVLCVDFSPLKNYTSAETIGGDSYKICSGSKDNTIYIWDIKSLKYVNIFKGHEYPILSVKYVSPELGLSNGANIILSGSIDQSVRLWDVRSAKQINVFDDHTNIVTCVEYLPIGNGQIICFGSLDNTVRFWDVRLNKQFDILKGNKGDAGLFCIKYLLLKKGNSTNQNTNDNKYVDYLCYGANHGNICVWSFDKK
ncbi:hypothetical protein RFI_29800 [Reticulomyxa filosa]|uniref:Uncharacterized protein n=1 Tax=Reticulomyxa filosa TaxID=46433 RepID=X6M2E8_RETFI|nr:hypothetical protein RFI_29800 [Reticulomyxa filosa]|eukprot:ETO07592.1 hypothetical protein RFI_29800 [Reticulomyxa filosa]